MEEGTKRDSAVKKAKFACSAFDKLLSLINSSDSLIAGDKVANVYSVYNMVWLVCIGLTYFLKNVKNDGEEGLGVIGEYLANFPDCAHILAPLEWEKDKKTYDVVRLQGCMATIIIFSVFGLCRNEPYVHTPFCFSLYLHSNDCFITYL